MPDDNTKKPAAKKPKNNTLLVNFISTPPYKDKLLYVKEIDTFFIYKDGKYYRPVDLLDVRCDIWSYLANHWPEVGITNALIDDIVKQMRMAAPARVDRLNDHYIALNDCLLNIDTLEAEEFDRTKVATVYFPFSNADIANAPIDTFTGFLNTVLVDEEDTSIPDTSLITVMQEIFGYLLSPSLKASAAFFFYGSGSNGKSTITDLLSAFFGEESVSAYSIENLTTRPFTVAGLIGKRINICNEDESKFIRSDKFKAMVSGESVAAERKFGDTFDFRPTTKFVFCTNKMPTFEGVDYGLRRRVKIIPFFRRISDKEKDVHFASKLIQELPGILRWSLDGLKRLKENNYTFSESESESMQRMKKEFMMDASSVVNFFEEFYVIDSNEFTPMQQMYDEYKSWCEKVSRKYMSMQNFGKELNSAYSLRSINKKINGSVMRCRTCKRKPDTLQDIMNLQTKQYEPVF